MNLICFCLTGNMPKYEQYRDICALLSDDYPSRRFKRNQGPFRNPSGKLPHVKKMQSCERDKFCLLKVCDSLSYSILRITEKIHL